MWRAVVVLNTNTKFREKKIPSPFLHSEGRVKEIIFSRNFVYVLRTKARHMVSFIDFCFHFLANFQT